MDDNQSYKISSKKIKEDNLRFRIPLYQRLFAWKTSEVRQLMEDLQNHFEKHSEKSYYLGMITVVKQGDRLDLIDGQQRITVITLLAIAFIKALESGESKDWNSFFNSANRVYFNGRSQDMEYLLRLKDGKSSSYKNVNMAEGLLFIEKYLKENFTPQKLVRFANQVYNWLTIFVTELPSHYVEAPTSLNEYFEAMNSGGKSLEQHEILKVELLKDYSNTDKLNLTKLWNIVSDFEKPLIKLVDSQVDRKEQIRRYIDCIEKCREEKYAEVIDILCVDNESDVDSISIAEIEVEKHEFRDNTPKDKEDSIISFPQFLLLVLALHLNKDEIAHIHPSKLHDTFKAKENRITADKIGDFYHDLLFYRILMDMYVTRLKYSSSSSSHKLISRDIDDEDKNEHAHERLRQFQAMLDVSTEHHIWLLPFLKHLRNLDHNPSQIELLKFLMILDLNRDGHDKCPDQDSLDYSSKPRYWLWRMDYAIWEKLIIEGKESFSKGNLHYDKFDVDAIRYYEFRANRSIEHLHPQNEDNNDNWPWKDVNSFGNLAMISQGFNSQQSNLPIHVKFANIEVQIGNKNLQSLKLYFMYLKAKGSDSEWTITAKNEHAREMMDILKQSIEKIKSYGQAGI